MRQPWLWFVCVLFIGCDAPPSAVGDAGPGGFVPPDAGDAGPIQVEELHPMPRVSDDLPSFASGGNPEAANDGNTVSVWDSGGTLPAWIAYDLSSLPVAQRGRVVVSWANFRSPAYLLEELNPEDALPTNYTIEVNDAPSAASAPTTGWRTLDGAADNLYAVREHVVDLGGANWVRLHATASMRPDGVIAMDLDIYDASAGFIDGWLMMGDSISYISLSRWTSDLHTLVPARAPGFTPFFDCAAAGGTGSGDGLALLDAALPVFPGQFIAVAYGTNDGNSDGFYDNMRAIVERILAAGRTPVIPTVPWPNNDSDARVQTHNQRLEQLYEEYPGLVRGPDLYALFHGHDELVPPGDVHPTGEGSQALRRAWADAMAARIYSRAP